MPWEAKGQSVAEIIRILVGKTGCSLQAYRRWACAQLELEKKLRTLLTKEKEKAEEEAALAMGLCTGGSIF